MTKYIQIENFSAGIEQEAYKLYSPIRFLHPLKS